MERSLPITTLHQLLKRQIVGDDNLLALLECIRRQGLLQDKLLLKRLLGDTASASRLWRVVADSHESLAPLLLAALPHLAPIDAKASELLQRLGIGKGLSARSRGLRGDQIAKLLEATEGCRDLRFVRAFFHHLAHAWPRLGDPSHSDERFEYLRTNYLFTLCKRLAQLDQWAFKGWTGLPQPTVFAICPYLANRPQRDPEAPRYANQPHLGIGQLRRVLEAVLEALVKAVRPHDIEQLAGDLDHVLDWLSTAPIAEIDVPEGISLQRLYARADEWVRDTELSAIPDKAWPCALSDNEEAWRSIEQSISRELRVIPLADTARLIEESRHMKHCVAPVYWKQAVRGKTRLFSIEKLGAKFATLELTFNRGWRCIQLKGPRNLELIQHVSNADSSLGRLCLELATFYNARQPTCYPSARAKSAIRRVETHGPAVPDPGRTGTTELAKPIDSQPSQPKNKGHHDE